MAQHASTGDPGNPNYENLKADFESLKKDVGRLADTLGRLIGDEAGAAKETVKTRAQQARAEALRARDMAEAELHEVMGQTRATIAQRPIGSVAAALGVGILLGLLLRRH